MKKKDVELIKYVYAGLIFLIGLALVLMYYPNGIEHFVTVFKF